VFNLEFDIMTDRKDDELLQGVKIATEGAGIVLAIAGMVTLNPVAAGAGIAVAALPLAIEVVQAVVDFCGDSQHTDKKPVTNPAKASGLFAKHPHPMHSAASYITKTSTDTDADVPLPHGIAAAAA